MCPGNLATWFLTTCWVRAPAPSSSGELWGLSHPRRAREGVRWCSRLFPRRPPGMALWALGLGCEEEAGPGGARSDKSCGPRLLCLSSLGAGSLTPQTEWLQHPGLKLTRARISLTSTPLNPEPLSSQRQRGGEMSKFPAPCRHESGRLLGRGVPWLPGGETPHPHQPESWGGPCFPRPAARCPGLALWGTGLRCLKPVSPPR